MGRLSNPPVNAQFGYLCLNSMGSQPAAMSQGCIPSPQLSHARRSYYCLYGFQMARRSYGRSNRVCSVHNSLRTPVQDVRVGSSLFTWTPSPSGSHKRQPHLRTFALEPKVRVCSLQEIYSTEAVLSRRNCVRRCKVTAASRISLLCQKSAFTGDYHRDLRF